MWGVRRLPRSDCCGRPLLQVFIGCAVERMLIEQLQQHAPFRWFVGMEMDEVVWKITRCTARCSVNEEIAESFFQRVRQTARPYMSDEHFTVDETLNRGLGQSKELSAEGRKGEATRTRRRGRLSQGEAENETHESTTDPDARLFKKSKGSEAKLGYLGVM